MSISLDKIPDFVIVDQRFSTQVSRYAEGVKEADEKGGLLKSRWNDIKYNANKLMEEVWQKFVKNHYLNIRHNPETEHLAEELGEIYWMNYPQAHSIASTRKKLNKMDLGQSEYAKDLRNRATELLDFYEDFAQEVNRTKGMIKTQAELKEREVQRKIDSGEIKPKPQPSKAVVKKLDSAIREALSEVRDNISADLRRMMERVIERYYANVNPDAEHFRDTRKNSPYSVFKGDGFSQYIASRLLSPYAPGSTPAGVFGKVEDYDQKLASMVEGDTRDIIDKFVYKQLSKIPAIIDGLGTPVELGVMAYNKAPIEGHVKVKMENGAEFTARTQVVYAHSVKGNLFARYPTTFHDVYGPGGKYEGKQLSEEEMIKLAGPKGSELEP